jgi:hypothetical protein
MPRDIVKWWMPIRDGWWNGNNEGGVLTIHAGWVAKGFDCITVLSPQTTHAAKNDLGCPLGWASGAPLIGR